MSVNHYKICHIQSNEITAGWPNRSMCIRRCAFHEKSVKLRSKTLKGLKARLRHLYYPDPMGK